jgi:hypothetical protein
MVARAVNHQKNPSNVKLIRAHRASVTLCTCVLCLVWRRFAAALFDATLHSRLVSSLHMLYLAKLLERHITVSLLPVCTVLRERAFLRAGVEYFAKRYHWLDG